MIIAGSGHRIDRLGLTYSDADRDWLRAFVRRQLEKIECSHIISGMATGFDQALAGAAVDLKIPYTAAIPFPGQESKWPLSGQRYYHALLANAVKIETICQSYSKAAFLRRDEWMVNESNGLICLFDGIPGGGTAHTVSYAASLGKSVTNLWDTFINECFKKLK